MLKGIKIWDDTGRYYYTDVNLDQSLTHNRPTQTVTTLYNKYPYHIRNGKASYFSGTCKGNFSENINGECYDDYNWETREVDGHIIYNVDYITGFVKWLHNDHMKYLQLSERLVIPCGILSTIDVNIDETIDEFQLCTVSFSWEQEGAEYAL